MFVRFEQSPTIEKAHNDFGSSWQHIWNMEICGADFVAEHSDLDLTTEDVDAILGWVMESIEEHFDEVVDDMTMEYVKLHKPELLEN